MRTLTDHKVNGLNEALEITADGPGPGGASHKYNIIGSAEVVPNIGPRPFGVNLRFQNGPISKPEDMNGITNEALIAVVIDRMRGFQHERNEDGSFNFSSRGKYACKENACALTHLEEALMWLQKRTRDRMARGVEGTHKV
jgi:hypothetical protein